MATHRELREALGAHAVGALPPSERAEVEAHLADCVACRDVLSALAPLPGLLARLGADEVGGAQPAAPLRVGDLLARVATARRRERRVLAAWRVMAAAAAVALVAFVMVPLATAPPQPTVPVVVVAPAVEGASGTVATHAWEWGTTVALELEGLPAAQRYEVVVVAMDGHREPVGSWTGTAEGYVRWRGGTGVATDDVLRVEVLDADGNTLLAALPQEA